MVCLGRHIVESKWQQKLLLLFNYGKLQRQFWPDIPNLMDARPQACSYICIFGIVDDGFSVVNGGAYVFQKDIHRPHYTNIVISLKESTVVKLIAVPVQHFRSHGGGGGTWCGAYLNRCQTSRYDIFQHLWAREAGWTEKVYSCFFVLTIICGTHSLKSADILQQMPGCQYNSRCFNLFHFYFLNWSSEFSEKGDIF